MKDLYTYYINVNKIDTKMTISEFSNFVLSDVLTNQNYASSFDETTINNIKMLATFSDINTINKSMNSKELSNLFGLEEQTINQLLLLKYINTDNGTKLSIAEFINTTIYLKNNTTYLNNVDISSLEKIDESTLADTTKYTATELSKILNIETSKMYNIYGLIDFSKGNTYNWKMTPNELVTFILKNSDNESIKNNLNKETIAKLKLLSNIMTSTNNKTNY